MRKSVAVNERELKLGSWRGDVPMASSKLEKRMEELEDEVAALRKKVEALTGPKPWWERIAGTFEKDPIYEEAMKLGRKHRQAQRPNGVRKRNG
jgi:hypothetical protein